MSYILAYYHRSLITFDLTWCVLHLSRQYCVGSTNLSLQFLKKNESKKLITGAVVPVTVCVLIETQKKESEREKMSSAPSPSFVSLEGAWAGFPVLCGLSHRVAHGVGSGEKKVAFTSSLQPVLSSVVHDAVNLTSVHLAHFFLPDFSERFPPRSDFSDRSPFSLSFSISFSLSLSALSMRSALSERSPPLSDLLSALLPSRRVPSSVEEVVGWGWPRLAISSCSEILVLMLFTHVFRSSYTKWQSTNVSWMLVISSQSLWKLLTDFWQSM